MPLTAPKPVVLERRSSHVVDHNAKGVAWIEHLISSAIAEHDLKYSGRDNKWQPFDLLNHNRKVANENEKISRYAGESQRDIWVNRLSGLSHDFGKIEEVCELYRAARVLTHEELVRVREHPVFSGERVRGLKERLKREQDGFLRDLLDEVAIPARWHHEPFLVENPRLRVVACRTEVTDIFVSIQEDRERPGKSLREALIELGRIEEYLMKKDPRHKECMEEILRAAGVIQALYTIDPMEIARQLG